MAGAATRRFEHGTDGAIETLRLPFLALSCDQLSLHGVITARRKDWHSAAIGAVLSSDLGAKGAPRSCPAGLIADAGLRWCDGDAVTNRMEDLNVKVGQEAGEIIIVY